MEEKNLALSILNDYKTANKRFFIALIIVIIMWFLTICGFVYYISNYGIEEITEISEVETDSGNANACIGNNCNNGEINDKGESNKNN